MGSISIERVCVPLVVVENSVGSTDSETRTTSITTAFLEVGIDASFDESTSEESFARKLDRWRKLSGRKKEAVWKRLLVLNEASVETFREALERVVRRQIAAIRIVPLHGNPQNCDTLDAAIAFVRTYAENNGGGPLLKYEVQIRFDNGNRIEAVLEDREEAIDFLQMYEGEGWIPQSTNEGEK